MKIAIINDSHYGFKNSSQAFFDYQLEFLQKTFFPYCKRHKIDRILHLGDLFDNRKYVTVKTLNFVRIHFLEELRKRNMHMDILPGNHDVHFNNTNGLCSLVEILSPYSDVVSLYMDPAVIRYNGMKVGIVPWITKDNQEQCYKFIQTAKCDILAGHFEIAGFKYIANSGIKSTGISTKIFERYDHVLSGHYHTKSHQENITYLGTQVQFNWGDVDDRKFFHVLDTQSREIAPVENRRKIFTRLYYDDDKMKSLEDVIRSNHIRNLQKKVESRYVRIIVQKKANYFLFDQLVKQINEYNPHNLSIVENYALPDVTSEEEETLIEDTSELIDSYIDSIDTDLDKDRLKKLMQELYTEASVFESL